MEKKTKVAKKDFIYGLGRRKRSVARVRLFTGKGQTMINEQPIGEYFKNVSPVQFFKPFDLTETTGKYYATAKVEGGGKAGQLGAFLHGLSRALSEVNPEKFRKPLKSAGLLTRDPREKERRKPGLAQSARAKKQSPKR
ncbi:30S ribosomal protein S9 [Candidatus Microgenomates bacterium]|jgi:small subunit ribosomal protein S9|nr:MAG: 30S ribosomal protein S9 [Candidatus Microgenomates bacterium]